MCGFNPTSTLVNRQKLPFTLDRGIAHRAAIGLVVLATDQTIEHEWRQMLRLDGVAFYESRIYNSPTITPETLAEMASGIAAAAALIKPGIPLDALAYGCTSGAMVMGQIHSMQKALKEDEELVVWFSNASETLRVMDRKAAPVPSIMSWPPAPWMCTSIKPGMAVLSVARTSWAPAGKVIPERGPMASMESSRIRMPASLISVIGVSARPA